MRTATLPFWLVDVFAREPLAGNGLSVFLLDDDLPASMMQRITREMRQFETIFLTRIGKTSRFGARIFTMEEELLFAGHPIIGAAALMHMELFTGDPVVQLGFVTAQREIPVTSHREESGYSAEMDQGTVTMEAPVSSEQGTQILKALNLSDSDLAAGLPLQVVSTGLPYLIVPIRSNLARARIVSNDFEAMLASVGASFVYVLDVGQREGRTWDNDGRVEDIATGSAAGPAAAYLVTYGLANPGETFVLSQGRFVDRPSDLYVAVRDGAELSVAVRGEVCFAGRGTLKLPGDGVT